MAKTQRKVLITGGAGYIGRCLAFECEQAGLHPIIVDDFSTSKQGPHTKRWTTLKANLVSPEEVARTLSGVTDVHAVFHLAARALVQESCLNPELYFRNNISSAINIAEWAAAHKVGFLIHSSTCAVYGMPEKFPIQEDSPLRPINPYGESKAIVERIFSQIQSHRGIRTINLRYFNPAGSVDDGKLGEDHDPETHLVPNVVRAFMHRKPIYIFGTDYPTEDGTCVRDFIHIHDLAQAHIHALRYLENNKTTVPAMNLGTGHGISIKNVVKAAREVFGTDVPVEIHPRRPGDAAVLIADSSRAHQLLEWKPSKTIHEMISDHRTFEELRSRGNMGK